MTADYTKPLPVPANAELSRPFWDAARRHELVMPRCKNCANLHFYPREQCPNCYSSDTEWVPVSGKGRVYSYTVIYQPAHRSFQPDTPYVYAMIQLDEGTRIPANLVECEVGDAAIDMRVEAVFEDVTSEHTLVRFRPA